MDIRLEGGWRVGQAKRYNQVFKEPVSCFKRRLLFVAFFDSEAVVRIAEVKLSKHRCST